MHAVNRLVSMLPIQQMILNEDNRIPEGFDYVVTHDSQFVVTNTGQNVIAKAP
jgi:hypothetical protein